MLKDIIQSITDTKVHSTTKITTNYSILINKIRKSENFELGKWNINLTNFYLLVVPKVVILTTSDSDVDREYDFIKMMIYLIQCTWQIPQYKKYIHIFRYKLCCAECSSRGQALMHLWLQCQTRLNLDIAIYLPTFSKFINLIIDVAQYSDSTRPVDIWIRQI